MVSEKIVFGQWLGVDLRSSSSQQGFRHILRLLFFELLSIENGFVQLSYLNVYSRRKYTAIG
jgi:hypothetical protein